MIKAVIFDLDGTLADTAELGVGRREPWQLLEPGLHDQRDWRWSAEVSDLPGELISRGYRVAIATRAPLPYASTLLHLIGADVHVLLTSCGSGFAKSQSITGLLARAGIEPTETIYVGDEPDDAAIASRAGVHFATVDDLLSGRLRPRLLATPPGRVTARDAPAGHTAPAFTDGAIRAGGASRQASEISGRLAASMRAGVPNELEHSRLLDLCFRHDDISTSDRAALCYFTLLVQPGLADRRVLQHGLLGGATSKNAHCLIRNTTTHFDIHPTLLTGSELRSDPDLRHRLYKCLSRVVPARFGQLNVDDVVVPFRFLQTYKVQFGAVLGVAKNYGGPPGSRFRSGPEVELGRLGLIADLMAASLETAPNVPIVPIPASVFSRRQPGEVSDRLAALVAARIGGTVKNALRRTGDEITVDESTTRGEVILFDDQTTQGTTLMRAAMALHRSGFTIREAISFSASPPAIALAGARPHDGVPTCGFKGVADWLGIRCGCAS